MSGEPLEPPPVPRTARKRPFWRTPLGCLTFLGVGVGGLILAAIAVLGVGSELGWFPPTEARSGAKLHKKVVPLLREHGIIEPGEEVQYLYSSGLLSYLEVGCLFTDRRVISYWNEDGELETFSAVYADITEIDAVWSKSMLDDSVITVTLNDGTEFELWVARDGKGDRRFYDALVAMWKRER